MPNQYPIVNPWEGLQGGLQDFTKSMLNVRQMRLQEEEAATQKLYRERQLRQMDMEVEEAERKKKYLGELGKLPSQPGYVRGLSESGLAGQWGYDPMPGLAQYKADKEIEEGIQTGLVDKIYSSVAGKAGEPKDFDWRKRIGVGPEATWEDFIKPYEVVAPNVLMTKPKLTPFGTMQSARFTKAPGSKEWKHDWQDWKPDKPGGADTMTPLEAQKELFRISSERARLNQTGVLDSNAILTIGLLSRSNDPKQKAMADALMAKSGTKLPEADLKTANQFYDNYVASLRAIIDKPGKPSGSNGPPPGWE